MCSKVLNGHIILTDTSITTILAPEMTYTPKFYFRKTLLPKNRRMKRHNTCNGDVRTDIPVFRTAYKQKRAGDRPENKNGNLARFGICR